MAWFYGRNRLGQPVFDPASGAAFDGLSERGVNLNQGAESAISVLLALLASERFADVEPPGRPSSVRTLPGHPSATSGPWRARPTAA